MAVPVAHHRRPPISGHDPQGLHPASGGETKAAQDWMAHLPALVSGLDRGREGDHEPAEGHDETRRHRHYCRLRRDAGGGYASTGERGCEEAQAACANHSSIRARLKRQRLPIWRPGISPAAALRRTVTGWIRSMTASSTTVSVSCAVKMSAMV
jgi:hypothetical protein